MGLMNFPGHSKQCPRRQWLIRLEFKDSSATSDTSIADHLAVSHSLSDGFASCYSIQESSSKGVVDVLLTTNEGHVTS